VTVKAHNEGTVATR